MIMTLVALLLLQTEPLDFFESRIGPVLAEHGSRCHRADARKLKAGLRLDHAQGYRVGVDSGPAGIPERPDESLPSAELRC